MSPSLITFGGQKWPDFVGALHVKQGWGEAQVSGVIHDVNVQDIAYNAAPFNNVTASAGCGVTQALACNAQHNQIGWASTPAKVNLPSFGPAMTPSSPGPTPRARSGTRVCRT